MATPARSYHLHGLKLATIIIITVLFIFFFSMLFSISGGSMLERNESLKERKLIGSKPPACLNKCLNCKPCTATLVVPNKQKLNESFKVLSSGDHDQDDPYYLLAWKCSCGNKLYQP